VSTVLPDYLAPELDVVLVGINPGIRSAEKGHHFAGPGNRFWRLLSDSGLTPRRLEPTEDGTLPDYGIGITNIVPRASRSSGDLKPGDYAKGRRALVEKIFRFRPTTVALVGVTVFRELWPELSSAPAPKRIKCGQRPETIGASAMFVLPNPSGRNAHYTYDEMLGYWSELAKWLKRLR
jgi:double-stranded uracil-DNA glycosylase